MLDGFRHYIKIDDRNRVLHGYSDAFEQPESNDICIADDAGRHFELFGEINPQLTTVEGVPLYKWDSDQVVKRLEQEIQADVDALPPHPPSAQERLEALEQAMLDLILGGDE